MQNNEDLLRSILHKELHDILAQGWTGSREFVINQWQVLLKLNQGYLSVSCPGGHDPLSVELRDRIAFDDDPTELGKPAVVSLKSIVMYTLDMKPTIRRISLYYTLLDPTPALRGILIEINPSSAESLFIETDIVDGLHIGSGANTERWIQWQVECGTPYEVVEL